MLLFCSFKKIIIEAMVRFIGIFFCVYSFSTQVAVGQLGGRITYKAILAKNGLAPVRDELIIQGSRSTYRLLDKSNPDQVVVDDQTGTVSFNRARPDSVSDFIVVDFSKKIILSKVFVTEDSGDSYKSFKTQEPFSISWVVSSESKKIGSYKCRKAVTKFRGRSYQAWFTEEIPIPAGPWKFVGLPGLILQLYDDSGQVAFMVEEITIPSKDNVKVPTDFFRSTISIAEFAKIRKAAEAKSDRAFRARVLSKLPRGATIDLTNDDTNEIEKNFDDKLNN